MLRVLSWGFLLSVLIGTTNAKVHVPPANAINAKYTSYDDVSWAITRPRNLADKYHQDLYDNFMKQCNQESPHCQSGEEFRLMMNKEQPAGVYNYTKMGFQKIRVPDALWKLLSGFWESNRDLQAIEWKTINSYHNMWEAPPYFVSLENAEIGGGHDLQRQVWNEVRPVLEEWTGQRLSPVSMYGIRVYKNNSILAPHVDRNPLVTSCIINIDQDLDEPWPLEVFDHDGNAHNVTMEPGDMVLYESHSVIHGRPFPMQGRAFVNVFLHFEPIGPLDDITKCGPNERGLPPYVIPGGNWEAEWRKSNQEDWKINDNVPYQLSRGDYRALEYIAYTNPELLLKKDYNFWAPIHEAVYRGDLEGTKFLLANGATIHDCIGKDDDGPDVFEIARQSPMVNEEHPVWQYLMELQEDEAQAEEF